MDKAYENYLQAKLICNGVNVLGLEMATMAEIVIDRRQRHHVLAIPVPAQGHLNPLMRLCKVLASQGFTITFLNIDPIHHRIAQLHQQHDPAAATTSGVLDAVMKSERTKAEAFQGGLAGLPLLRNGDLPHFRHIQDDTEYFYHFLMHECDEAYKRADAIVVNSFDGLEDPAFQALQSRLDIPILPVGPLVEHNNTVSLWKEDMACLEWLDMQPPRSVLYISFGSITLLSKTQFEEIMAGLLSSQQRFLWVFRSDLVVDGAFSDPDTFLADLLSKSKDRGCVVAWAPQIRVLSHPSLGSFLTHCGWNSTLEAIAHGVPMLCWPYFGDQFLDAKYIVEEWKVGLGFKASGEDGLTTRDEMERVIRAIMEGEEGKSLRNNAIQLKEAGRKSLSPGGTSHKNIQTLIQSLMINHNISLNRN